ncbi:unnamed protein product [Soboliphyme baturini]|uniref:Cysteine protease n=1 Tax=Soboliphyme baturini TaxID=241478 RepID=A0A183IPL3_9BILA|nr:unnamed protein product [Soboliphyme baturini]
MLRCGQMLLAQAMVMKHLGRGMSCDASYAKILRMFQDKKNSLYSIHQIAQMGESEGKGIGEWFGPNTVMQVLKKLSMYDTWNKFAIHIAMNSAVVIEDQNASFSRYTSQQKPPNYCWRPLLLVIPLRLGLLHLNPCYVQALKVGFFILRSPRCFGCSGYLGMIGGRPNHALYFIGLAGDKLIYLDPHASQISVDLDEGCEALQDASYHSTSLLSMPVDNIDPSIAIAFYCESEIDFDAFCDFAQQELLAQHCPLFEILEKHPATWPRFQPYVRVDEKQSGNHVLPFDSWHI